MAELVEGGTELRAVALRLKAAGEAGLLSNMRRNIRAATLPAKDAVRQSAMSTLPAGGGLNAWVVSSTISTNILTGPRTAGVRVRVSKKGHDAKDIDAGTLRHPVYGNRKRWVSQTVPPGFASRPLLAMAPSVTAACLLAMRQTASEAGFHTAG